MSFELSGKCVWVAGHRGMVGGAVARRLESEECEVLMVAREVVDLLDQVAVKEWMAEARPDAIVVAAAKVGGIHANNSAPVDFLQNNLAIQNNILAAAHACDVDRLLFLGSSCIYPKFAEQPIHEDSLLTGALEPTNEWYAIAKIAGIKLCQAYRKQYGRDWISAMPTNLYGPHDNFDEINSHVIPGLISRMHKSKLNKDNEFSIWGTGKPLREFLFVDDLAYAIKFIVENNIETDLSYINNGLTINSIKPKFYDLIIFTVNHKQFTRFPYTKLSKNNVIFDLNDVVQRKDIKNRKNYYSISNFSK